MASVTRTRVRVSIVGLLIIVIAIVLLNAAFEPRGDVGDGTGGATVDSSRDEIGRPLAFSVTGGPALTLRPGVASSIDAVITNPNDYPLEVMQLEVRVDVISAPQSTSALRCTMSDFAVVQLQTQTQMIVPSRKSLSLSEMGIPSSEWPRVEMTQRATNQDGCKAAVLTLWYEAEGRET